MIKNSRLPVNVVIDCLCYDRQGLAQDVPLFYTSSHLSELQSCKSIVSTHCPLLSYLNSAQHNSFIELCRALRILKILSMVI